MNVNMGGGGIDIFAKDEQFGMHFLNIPLLWEIIEINFAISPLFKA